TVTGANYNLSGRFLRSGLARVCDDTDGRGHGTVSAVSGTGGPKSCDLAYKPGRKNPTTPIRVATRNVGSAEHQHPLKKRDPWGETAPQDLL
ncbi:DUF3108 domain-containing protein, partial [Brucella oryzae]